MNTFRLLFSLLFLFLNTASAEPPLEIIELQSRGAEELVPMLKPLAGEKATVAGQGRHLFLRAAPERMEELRQIIETLDRPPRQLMISVYQGRLSTGQLDALRIDTGLDPKHQGNSLRNTRTRNRLDATHRVRASDGQAAFIATGRSYPVPYSGFSAGAGGVQHYRGTDYRDALNGFYATPRLRGEQVTLEISPRSEHRRNGGKSFEVQRASTTLTGRLGEWMEIGGVSTQTDREGSDILKRRSTRINQDRHILLKVDALATPGGAAPGSPPANTASPTP